MGHQNGSSRSLFHYQGGESNEERQTGDKLNFQLVTILANRSTQAYQVKGRTKIFDPTIEELKKTGCRTEGKLRSQESFLNHNRLT